MAASTSSLLGSLVAELTGALARAPAGALAGAFLVGVAVWVVAAVKEMRIRTRTLAMFLVCIVILDFRFLGNREAPAKAKRLVRDLQTGRSLLALVFTALDSVDHVQHQLEIVSAFFGNLLRGMIFLNEILKNIVQHVTRRQGVTVPVYGPQLR